MSRGPFKRTMKPNPKDRPPGMPRMVLRCAGCEELRRELADLEQFALRVATAAAVLLAEEHKLIWSRTGTYMAARNALEEALEDFNADGPAPVDPMASPFRMPSGEAS